MGAPVMQPARHAAVPALRNAARAHASLQMVLTPGADGTPGVPRYPVIAPGQPESARAPVVASPEAVCAACGWSLAGAQRVACSGRCRAALARRRRDEAQPARDTEIRVALGTIAHLVPATLGRLERGS